jgi:hypothetical protein
MDTIRIKFTPSQASSIYHYKNLRSKILKCNANIFFNKQCLLKHITPKYANIKIPVTSKAAKVTQSKISTIRIKDEIKFLYKKKDHLNKELFQAHLKVAQEWGNTWHLIREYLHSSIHVTTDRKYNALKQKLNKLEHAQTNTPKQQHTFYPRVINNTSIQFSTDELILLNKGLKYNLPFKHKNWVKTLALEAETAIAQLPFQDQDCLRTLTAHKLKQLYKQQFGNTQLNSTHAIREFHTLKQIKNKLERNEAMVSKADKGNSIVILYQNDYHSKVKDFINSSNFTILKKNPTKSFQSKIKSTIKNCPAILPKNSNINLTTMNPIAPNIRGLPKVHKVECPIRPIINWRGAPAFKLAKFLNKLIHTHIPLPYAYNITKSKRLMDDLLGIPHEQGKKLASLDIVNMYPNIPTNELIPIMESMAYNNQIDMNTTQDDYVHSSRTKLLHVSRH